MLILSPDLPPRRGGLADHTWRLARTLAEHGPVHLVSSPGVATEGLPPVLPVADWQDAARIRSAIGSAPADSVLLWQYVPHMYGRGGVNAAVPAVLAALRRAGRRQLVLAHEIAAPLSAWPQRLAYALAQRRQWRAILAAADHVAFSTEAWWLEWRRRRPDLAPHLSWLASPASFPVAPVPPDHRSAWLAAHGLPPGTGVLGFFGTPGAAKQFDWALAAWRKARAASPDRPLALVGVGDPPALRVSPAEAAWCRPLGFLPAAEASAALQAMDLLLLPFLDGVSERRTSFMAGLAHGVAVATTVGHNTGPTLRESAFCWLSPATDPAAFAGQVVAALADPAGRRQRAAAGQAHYAAHYDWPVAGRRLGEQLAALARPR